MIVGLKKKMRVMISGADFLPENPRIQYRGYIVDVSAEDPELERFDEATVSTSVDPSPGNWVIVKIGREYSIQRFPISNSGLLVGKVTCFYQSFQCN